MYETLDFTKLKPVNYNRKSSEDEDRQMLSIDSQLDEAKRISDFYKLTPFVESFKESKSAKTENVRPEFSRMMTFFKLGLADSIVCWKLDRLARNMTEGGIIIDLLSSGTIKAIITHDKVFYPWDNVIVMSVEFSQGKQYVKDLSTNVMRGQKKKATLGVPHGMASLGFLNNKTEEAGNRNWKVDEDRLWKVKKLFEMFLTGTISASKLYDYAIKELKLDTVKRKRIGGRLITLSRIYEILRDPVYSGFFFYNKIRYQLDKNLPRLISEDQHEKVKQILAGKNIPKFQHHPALYGGFIKSEEGDYMGQDIKFQLICDCKNKFAWRSKERCPKCNAEICNLKKPKYLIRNYYYNVRKKRGKLPYKCLNEEIVTQKVKEYVSENLDFSNSLLEWSRKYIHELKNKEVDENLLMEKDKKTRSEVFEGKKRKMRELLREDKITPQEYAEDLVLLNKEYEDTGEPTKKIDWYSGMMEITNIIEDAKDVIENGTQEAKRAIFSRMGSTLIWNEEILNVYSMESINILVDGIKNIRLNNPEFDPRKYQVPQGLNEKTEPKDPVISILLPR